MHYCCANRLRSPYLYSFQVEPTVRSAVPFSMNRVLTNHCSPVRLQRFSIPIKVLKQNNKRLELKVRFGLTKHYARGYKSRPFGRFGTSAREFVLFIQGTVDV